MIRSLGIDVISPEEEHFTAAELHFVDVCSLRITIDEFVHHVQRFIGLAGNLVSPGELIKNRVVPAIVGISLKQLEKKRDCTLETRGVERLHIARKLLDLGSFELEVGEPSHGFGPEIRVVRNQIEKCLVVVSGHCGAVDDDPAGTHVIALALEAFYRVPFIHAGIRGSRQQAGSQEQQQAVAGRDVHCDTSPTVVADKS